MREDEGNGGVSTLWSPKRGNRGDCDSSLAGFGVGGGGLREARFSKWESSDDTGFCENGQLSSEDDVFVDRELCTMDVPSVPSFLFSAMLKTDIHQVTVGNGRRDDDDRTGGEKQHVAV